MSYLDGLLTQPEISAHERADLLAWLSTLEGDCKFFGETSEDARRIAAIRAKLDIENRRP